MQVKIAACALRTAMVLLGTVMFFIRHRQESDQREIDALRRTVHAF